MTAALSPPPPPTAMSRSKPWGWGCGVSSAVSTDKARSSDRATRCLVLALTALLLLCFTRAMSWAVSALHLHLSPGFCRAGSRTGTGSLWRRVKLPAEWIRD